MKEKEEKSEDNEWGNKMKDEHETAGLFIGRGPRWSLLFLAKTVTYAPIPRCDKITTTL